MSLSESIFEAAAVEWFGLRNGCGGYSRVARTLIPAFSQGEKEEDSGVNWRVNLVLSGCLFCTRMPNLF